MKPLSAAARHIVTLSGSPLQVAYSLEEIQQIWPRSIAQIARFIQSGKLPARNNGGRYLVPGGAILDRTITPRSRPTHDLGLLVSVDAVSLPINDHRVLIKDSDFYTYGDLAALFGWGIQAVRRLNYNGLLQPDITNATRPLFSGALVRAYLDGCDAPIPCRVSA